MRVEMKRNNKYTIVGSIGFAQTLAWGSTFYLPAILADPISADLGISVTTIYLILSSAIIISAILGPVAGKNIDTRGGRVVLSISSLFFASGLCLLGLSENLVMYVAAWCLIGIGMSCGLYDAAFASLAGIYGEDSRGSITGVTLMAGLASSICWPITAYMEIELGWRTACFIWASCHVLLGLPLYYFMVPKFSSYDRRSEVKETVEATSDDREAPPVNLTMIILSLTFASLYLIFAGMATHLPRLLQEAGTSQAVAIAAASLMGPAQIAGRLADFAFMRQLHPLISARFAILTHPLGAILFLIFGAPAAMIFSVLHGIGSGILTIASGTIPLVLFGAAGYGLRQGMLMAPGRIGMAVSPFIFALLIEKFGASAVLFTIGLSVIGFTGLLLVAIRSHQTANEGNV